MVTVLVQMNTNNDILVGERFQIVERFAHWVW